MIDTILKINNTAVPNLKRYKVTPEELVTKADRNLRGDLKATRVAIKIKIYLEFVHQNEDDIEALATLLSPFKKTVQYLDPRDGTLHTGYFYCNTPEYSVYRKDNGMYEGFTLNLIEF